MFVEEKREGEVKPTTPMPEPWQQSCLEAANYLNTYGWIQGGYGGGIARNPACLIGALQVYSFGETFKYTYELMCGRLMSLPEMWNDLPERTCDDVVNFLVELGTGG